MKDITEDEKKRVKNAGFIKELMSGLIFSDKIVLKNLWYIIMLTILGAIYIGNRFQAERINRETSRLTLEVEDLRAEALSTSANLMSVSRQSEVFRLVRERGLGLEELKSPPYRLVADK